MAKGGHTPDWPPTAREAPLGRRTFAHWPHTTGCLSGQKGSHTYGPTGEAGFRLLATYGHTLREVASPLTGQRRDGRP